VGADEKHGDVNYFRLLLDCIKLNFILYINEA